MTPYETASTGLSVVAIVVSIISITIAVKSSNKGLSKADIQNLVALGTIELNMHELIRSSRQRLEDLSVQLIPLLIKKNNNNLNEDEKIAMQTLERVYHSSIETNINSYEEACSKYIDNKVDKERFRKIYFSEIRQLVEKSEYKEYFDGVTSRYKAVLKVYGEWYNLER